ncbi:hypothetical protein TNCV_4908031 [Trichonephila clavipes]|uniref:Transposase n=1 Tax=Trichonephila clavipes TaxID=2585209 RepID=A0A8X6V9P2_TRICX|nr:hypothetical protein TNCV_4908031 [Trichonephila clavipes]
MRNESHTTTLPENDRGQRAVKQLKRWPNQEDFIVHLGRLWKGINPYYIWPNTKFGFLLLTIESFEANSTPETAELANMRGTVFHQDNARPHTSIVTHQELEELNWGVFMYPLDVQT